MTASRSLPTLMVASLVALAGSIVLAQSQPGEALRPGADGFKFRTGVELINVTATVSDASGPVRLRPAPGRLRRLRGRRSRQEVTHFSAERVPVSLGIVLDTSGSMAGEKMQDARRGARSLPATICSIEQDEIFLYRFSNYPMLRAGLDDRSRTR